MTRRAQDVEYLDGFVKALWPAAVDLFGAEFTHAAVAGFNGEDEPPEPDEPPDDPSDPIPVPPPPDPSPGPPPTPPVPPVDPFPPDGPGDRGPVLNVADTGSVADTALRHERDPVDVDLDAGDLDVGDLDVGDLDLGDLDVGDLDLDVAEKALPLVGEYFKAMRRRAVELAARPRMLETDTRMDLDLPPTVSVTGTDQITVHFPGRSGFPPTGHHTFRTRIRLFGKVVGGLTRSRFRVELHIPLSITFSPDADADIPEPEIETHTNLRGRFVGIFHDWQDEIDENLDEADLQSELGFIANARYTPDAVGEVPAPEPVAPDRPVMDDGVNVVLVPDGFGPDELARFHAIVTATEQRLFERSDDHFNEPFHSFKSVLNLWTLIPEPSTDGDHVVGSYQPDADGSPKVALGNLARLAAVGRAAERALSGLTILVFVANHAAQRFGEDEHDNDAPRAMALGRVILQPTQGVGTAAANAWANTLLHELGHTPLGDLADEYVESGREHVRYRGQDREVANVEATWLARHWHQGLQPVRRSHPVRELVFPRWRTWMENPDRLPSWDRHPITAEEGGGLFGRWSWRPADDCAMNNTSTMTAPFCAVCREALTRGFQEVLPRGRLLFEVSDESRSERPLHLEPEGSATTITGHLHVPATGTGSVRVTLIAATLPEPWDVAASLRGDGPLEHRRAHDRRRGGPDTQHQWSFPAAVGDRLTVRITSDTPFTPWDDAPEFTIEFRCEAAPGEVRPPAVPDGLAARQVGQSPAGTPQQAMLSATTEDPNGQDVRIGFEVVRSGRPFRGTTTERTGWLSPPADGGHVTGEVAHRTLDGRYQVRARAFNRSGRSSSWSEPRSFELVFPRGNDGDIDDGRPGTGGNGEGGLPPHTP